MTFDVAEELSNETKLDSATCSCFISAVDIFATNFWVGNLDLSTWAVIDDWVLAFEEFDFAKFCRSSFFTSLRVSMVTGANSVRKPDVEKLMDCVFQRRSSAVMPYIRHIDAPSMMDHRRIPNAKI